MAQRYKSPGVYLTEVFPAAPIQLPTGVPAFVGFADPGSDGGPDFNQPVALHRKEEFATRFGSRLDSYLADAVSGFFDNGGIQCYVVRADPNPIPAAGLQNAIATLAAVSDLDLLAVPDAMSLRLPDGQPDIPACAQVQRQMLAHCAEQGNRLAILDSLPKRTTDGVLAQRASLTAGLAEPVNGALYYPWLVLASGRMVPPCGPVAGIFARSDARAGVFKSPANEQIFGILDLENPIDNSIQDQLNPEGVNCLRAFPGRGIRVWGARTLSRDPNWRYISVRRIFLTLHRWIDLNMAWVPFEPDGLRLWMRIQRELTIYLTTLLRAGALQGDRPEQAFYVKCDAETNPPDARDGGQVITEIGLAPLAPSEFIVVRIIHRAGSTEIS